MWETKVPFKYRILDVIVLINEIWTHFQLDKNLKYFDFLTSILYKYIEADSYF
jgi:hypothetical protein